MTVSDYIISEPSLFTSNGYHDTRTYTLDTYVSKLSKGVDDVGPVRTRFMTQASWGVVWVVRVLSACNLTPVDKISQTVIEFEDLTDQH